MKIYTKTGDSGQTGLFNGQRIEKNACRIEAYGTTDELNSFVGLLREELRATNANIFSDLLLALERVQNELFDLGAELANPDALHKPESIGITMNVISRLEQEIDAWTTDLPALRQFVLPGGHKANALAHVCRTICRRAERQVVTLKLQDPTQRETVLVYLNRLSDWFFTLARMVSKLLELEETKWSQKRER